MTGVPSNPCHRPRTRARTTPVPNRCRTAVCPIATITRGRTERSCSTRYGRQAASSSALGRRFPGGRHFTELVMNALDRRMPASRSASSRIFPAAPWKGLPARSSARPGASPIRKRRACEGPSPGTAWVRERWSAHSSHARIRRARPESSCGRRGGCAIAAANRRLAIKRCPALSPRNRGGPRSAR